MCRGVRLLVVSQDSRLCDIIKSTSEAEGHDVLCVPSAQEACAAFEHAQWDRLLLDVARRVDLDDLFCSSLRQKIESARTYILAENGDQSWRVHSQGRALNNVLMKPLLRQDITRLISECPIPNDASDGFRPDRENDSSFHMEELNNGSFFLAATLAMIQLHKKIRLLAEVDYPVLILGESGVGKEVVARLLHKYHARRDKPFINVNTAAIPSELLESELFGFEAGAFTGAVKAKPGKFELADQGTLLLDEIGEMSLQMQAKLLHVLQDGSLSRLGSRSSTRVDVRILAATNVDIETAVAEKRFREDLYYRINAFTIVVPSLRERREEIPILMEQMLARAAASAGRIPFNFSRKLMEEAVGYHWPGNIRELRNFVTRLLVLQDQDTAIEELRAKSKAKVSAEEVSSSIAQSPGTIEKLHPGMKSVVDSVKQQTESRLIKEALSASGWNRRRAALNLNISYRALLYKIQQHGIQA